MAPDTRDRLILFGGRAAGNLDDTWALLSPERRRPAALFTFDWSEAQANITDITSVAVYAVAGARGYDATSAPVDGFSVEVWRSDIAAWTPLTTSTAGPAAPTLATGTETDVGAAQSMIDAAQQMHVRVLPTERNGPAPDLAEVIVDFVDVTVSYTRP